MMRLFSGGITNASPFLLAFEDKNGINTASGIGHDIVAGGDKQSLLIKRLSNKPR
jgi:hypothetical protein